MMAEKNLYGPSLELKDWQVKEIEQFLAEFVDHTSAPFVMLMRSNGDIISEDKNYPHKDNVIIATLAVSGYSTSEELSQSIQFQDSSGQNRSDQFVLEGDENNIYISKVYEDILLVSVFPSEITIGMMLTQAEIFNSKVRKFMTSETKDSTYQTEQVSFEFSKNFKLEVSHQLDNLFLDNEGS